MKFENRRKRREVRGKLKWKSGRLEGGKVKRRGEGKCNDETKRSSEVRKRGAYKTHTIPLPSKTPDRQNRE